MQSQQIQHGNADCHFTKRNQQSHIELFESIYQRWLQVQTLKIWDQWQVTGGFYSSVFCRNTFKNSLITYLQSTSSPWLSVILFAGLIEWLFCCVHFHKWTCSFFPTWIHLVIEHILSWQNKGILRSKMCTFVLTELWQHWIHHRPTPASVVFG